MIPAFPYLRLRATLSAAAPARLPPFKGSLLRGAFGHSLRRMVCVMGPRQPCPSCNLRRSCIYPRLFETLIEGEPPPFLRGLATAPRPYVFEPQTDERRDYSLGDSLRFDLLLVGQAVELQGYAALAIERMARGGLGARRAPFRLDRLQYLGADRTFLDGWDGQRRCWCVEAPAILAGGEAAAARVGSGADETVPPEQVTLRFLTPTRILVRKRPVTEPPFRLLAFQMLRRILELLHFHVPGTELEWDLRPLLEKADAIETVHRLTWRDWNRFSNRQQRKVTLGGFLGEMTLQGDLGPFEGLLRTAEIIHIGKGTTLGMGKFELDW